VPLQVLANDNGNFAGGLYGITFTADGSVTAPTGAGTNNKFTWVQLVNYDTVQLHCGTNVDGTKACKTSGIYDCNIAGQPPFLDSHYPYPGTQTTTNDSPQTETLGNEQENELSRTFNARMYLMWDPGLNPDGTGGCTPATNLGTPTASTCTGSIPVALGSATWNFSGDAQNTFNPAQGVNGWILNAPNPSSPNTGPSFNLGNSYPQWTAVTRSSVLTDTTNWSCVKQ
jgi:hypothetical protein